MATATKQPPTKDAANGNVRVEIFDQVYNLRGSDADYILKLAEYVDGKMRAVSEQTATVDSVRLAVLAALNIADEYHLLKRRLESPRPELTQRAHQLASALDEVLQDTRRTG
ncbi:MAG: cell division protein ZapA [Acidobacteriia bacterium]|nr:cell division protein ZapA [Terriglobia bacterium]